MGEVQKSDKNVMGGPGITAGGNVTFGDVSGQVAIGEHIEQIQAVKQTDLEELLARWTKPLSITSRR